MRVTAIGHAGLYLQTAGGSVLCDPWVNPAYFASWFPFPDNSGLDWEALGQADYLYVSHLHRDHFDPQTLREHVSKQATVLLPDYPTDELHDALFELGFRSFVRPPSGEPIELDGLRVMIHALTSPTDGPIGDSALAIDDGTACILNQNDARPPELEPITSFGRYDAHFLQFSGAIWWPWVYELPDQAKAVFGRTKRANGLARAKRYVDGVGARYVVPSAGPPCFLDAPLRGHNDVNRDPTNTFPDHPVFLDHLRVHGHDGGVLMIPGSVADFRDGRCEVTHPVPDEEVARIFTDKASYLAAYAGRQADRIAAEQRTWPAPGIDILGELKTWFEPLLETAERIGAGVGGPVLLNVTGDCGAVELPVVIDFPAQQLRLLADDDRPRYTFWVQRPLIERLIAGHQVDWVNSLFLGMRFRASRVGPYNEFVYTFFKCLSPERLEYAEGWYAEQEGVVEEVQLGDWVVQRRCPHLKADLTRFGEINEGILHCSMHGWEFDLATGKCLTSEGHTLQARPAGSPPDQSVSTQFP